MLLFCRSLQYGTVRITADGLCCGQHLVTSCKYVTNTPDSRSGEKFVRGNKSTCLSKLVEQECHTEGEVFASDGVMSDFSLTEPARSRRESRVN